MKKMLCCILLFTAIKSFSQKLVEEFTFKTPEIKISGSLYNSMHIIDLRDDTATMGIVQKGAFNRKARVVANPSLSRQIPSLLQQMIDSSANQGQLQLVVREMSFTEVTTMKERGYYFLRADLYANTGKGYALLDHIDTVAVVKAMDVTKATLRNGSKHIIKFISDNLQREPVSMNDEYWSYEALTKIDSIEKSRIPLYVNTRLTDGIYDNYTSFKNQEPNRLLFSVKEKDGLISSVSVLNEKNKYEKLSPKKIYALVYQERPYVATEYGYYRLYKNDENWFFFGKYKTSASSANVVAAGFFFGIIGAAIAADSGSSEEGEMKIDYSTGAFKVVDKKLQK